MQLLSEIIIVLAYIAAIGFFIFGIDDLIFDLHFIRHLSRNKNRRHITVPDGLPADKRLQLLKFLGS